MGTVSYLVESMCTLWRRMGE